MFHPNLNNIETPTTKKAKKMKLDEVAGSAKPVKCGIILGAGNQSIDAGDWHGMSEVYTNKAAFLKAVKDNFLTHIGVMEEETGEENSPELIAKIKNAKSIDDLADLEEWDGFIDNVWIDDQF